MLKTFEQYTYTEDIHSEIHVETKRYYYIIEIRKY